MQRQISAGRESTVTTIMTPSGLVTQEQKYDHKIYMLGSNTVVRYKQHMSIYILKHED